jgi:NADH-quinone oxidoreductase subunit N
MDAALPYALAPLAILVGAALVTMVLEAAGTPVGARKLGARGYLASIAWAATVLAGAQVVAVLPIDIVTPLFTTDALTRRSALLLIVLLSLVVIAAVSGLRATDGERGEVYACLLLVAVGELAVVFSRELFVAYAGMTLTLVAGFGILVVERREGRGVEAAVKHVVASAFMLVLFGLGLALVYLKTGATDVAAVAAEGGIGTLIVVVVVLEGMLAFPLHVARLDVLTGAPAYAGALLVGGRAIASTTLLIRLVEAGLGGPAASMLIPVTLLSLVVPGLVAVDQREIPRAAAHLFIGHMGVALACIVGGASSSLTLAPIAAFVAAVAALGASMLFQTVPPVRRGFSWELWSGVGRAHPRFSLALLLFLSASSLLPLTPGLPLRLAAARTASALEPWLAFVLIVSSPLLLLTPLRLALFVFAKTREARSVKPNVDVIAAIPVILALAALLALGVALPTVTAFVDGTN